MGVLSLCNCFQTMAMEKQEAKVVSVESPRNSEVEQEIREITPNVPGEADLLNLKESEMIGSGHSFGEATWISVNNPVVDSLVEDDSNYYVFHLPKDGKINIDFSHELYDSSHQGWRIYLYDNNHNQIDWFYSSDGYTESKQSWNYGLPSGTYYLKIDLEYYTGRTYSFRVNYTQADNWETEFNDSWLSADKIQTNKAYYGSIPDESSDYYLFTLSRDEKITIDFSHELYDSSHQGWRIYLYDEDHNQIDWFYSSGGYTSKYKSQNYSLKAGIYYLRIDLEYYTGRNYSLKVNTKPCLNETFQSGNAYYKVKKDGITGEVQFTGMVNTNKTSVTIPSTVSCHGFSYKVTTVKSDAFKNNKKLKSVTLGNNITSLGSNVFYGCSNLKKITVKGTKLKKVGSGSLKGINKKAVIKVPKSKLTAYKKIFKGKGQAKSVKITK